MKNRNLIYLGVYVVVAYLLYKKFGNKVSVTETKAVLNDWKKNFDSKNLNGIVNNYSEDGILISTFGDILTGREAIKEYFVGLFKKDNLGVVYLGDPQIVNLNGSITLTGLYKFSYDKNDRTTDVKARYSFILKKINGKVYIIKQHSSVAN